MEKQMCIEVPLNERPIVLADNCDGVEHVDYMKKLSPEEIKDNQIILSEDSVKLAEYQAQLDKIKAEYKQKMNPLKNKIAQTVDILKHGHISVTEKCYKFIDGLEVGFYNSTGQLVKERPANSDEKGQATMFQVMRNEKTGTNN